MKYPLFACVALCSLLQATPTMSVPPSAVLGSTSLPNGAGLWTADLSVVNNFTTLITFSDTDGDVLGSSPRSVQLNLTNNTDQAWTRFVLSLSNNPVLVFAPGSLSSIFVGSFVGFDGRYAYFNCDIFPGLSPWVPIVGQVSLGFQIVGAGPLSSFTIGIEPNSNAIPEPLSNRLLLIGV